MARKKELTTVADKLEQLEQLQAIHSKIDAIHILKGELPIEVADLEDEIAGTKKRVGKIQAEIDEAEEEIENRKTLMKEAQSLITKYDKQLHNVKNNREFDALNKEIELQKLEIQLAEKKIKEANFTIENHKKQIGEVQKRLDSKEKDLEIKKKELDNIIKDTEKEEKELSAKAKDMEGDIEERFILAFNRIRKSYKNGLAVVKVSRNACGGCFGFIPPQTQSEIRTKKKISTCEHCGRIISGVDDSAVLISEEELA
ncbi:MAG: zinc ribbon domain protein [Bacteroidota bacterium]|nr:zinc ribbon domain protein [Bacteroidota bacterium]